MFALKTYQTETIFALREYLTAAKIIGPERAFNERRYKATNYSENYRPLLNHTVIPYVCLRLPTGGGKTLLAAHSVKVATEEYLQKEFPVVLWLVPTNTIRSQTLETLKKPGHPNHDTLADAFHGRFKIFDIADFAQVTPNDLRNYACIFVATMATLRVTSTDGRKVYANNENLEPHFTTVSASEQGLERIEEGTDAGKIKYSFRNLLALNRPLTIIDEAHNHSSRLSVDVLSRINTSCVIEFTATPAPDSNVLVSVTASQLKAEDMIKLPIRLFEHPSWEEAVRDSIINRERLAEIAAYDESYIRPIVLFQAEDQGQEITKQVLVQYLVEQEHIDRNRIAIVTGDQRELDNVNLFSPDCKIDFVITVEALKEGWDCSFAYVFCSVASVQSSTSVEQILGRVLRMPYARRRGNPELNRAYAHVSKSAWPNAVLKLHDKLVVMGFEKQEAEAFIEKNTEFNLDGGGLNTPYSTSIKTVITVYEDLSSLFLTPDDRTFVQVEELENGSSRLTFTGVTPASLSERITESLGTIEERERVLTEIKGHVAVAKQHASSSQRGIPFNIPQLTFDYSGDREIVEKETLLEANGWSLLDYPIEISESDFKITNTGIEWEVDLIGGEIKHRAIGHAEQHDLDFVDTGWTEGQLIGWLDDRLRTADIPHPVLVESIRRGVEYLSGFRLIPISKLARWRFALEKVFNQKINQARDAASLMSYQLALFAPDAKVYVDNDYAYEFKSDSYPYRFLYTGRYQFRKHYYPFVGELKNSGEEYECAQALDMEVDVKHWIRNLDKRGFWLPVAHGKTYPDFVAELNDGRIFVIEYKGSDRFTNEDSKQKALVGELWERKSCGKGIYLMAVKDAKHPPLSDQIRNKIVVSG